MMVKLVGIAQAGKRNFRHTGWRLPALYWHILYNPAYGSWRQLHQGHSLVASALKQGKRHADKTRITRSSGCVFTDLGLAPPEST